MRTSILIILIIRFVQSVGFGQTLLPPVFEITSDTAYIQTINSSRYQMLEDKAGKWTINDVTTLPLSDNFYYRNEKSSTRDTLSNVYWFRYKLKNSMDHEAKISLNSESEYDDFYLLEPDGKWKHFVSGVFNNWEKKDGLKYFNCIPLVLKPDEELNIYQRIKNDAAGLVSGFAISILSAEKVQKNESLVVHENYFKKMHIEEAFVVGLLFLAVFFNLFFFRIVHEKVYLYFALFVLFLCINRLYNISYSFFMIENAEWLRYMYYLKFAWVFIIFFLIQFFRHFFETKSRYPRWDKWLIGLAILNIIFYIIRFLSKIYFKNAYSLLPLTVANITFFFVPLSIIITLFLYTHSHDKSLRLVIIGSFPLMIFYLLDSLDGVAEALHITLGFSTFFETLNFYFRELEIICVTWMVLFFSWILFMRYDKLIKENAQIALDKERFAKEKEMEKNELISRQKVELEQQVAERTANLKQSLEDLKSTQTQLIQAEKMASLGELTAGIAHEIQNPLNFVNNFSEVSTELVDEMNDEIDKGNLGLVKEIACDLRQNLEKINHHGKRADAIVKGMLQHSRTSSGVKEPTDINALADEYLRLAYHGLRAKDKTFNVTMKTDFDETIGKINVIPQDIGRVILNLITNAFYAVTEKKQQLAKNLSGLENLTGLKGYEPNVWVSTKKLSNSISISVRDNGNGIPDKVLAKIFQPFFTTKPSGQGTGLGLSMSYEIVTKAHGGELKVDTKEGESAAFTIFLPL